jgi:hypothetical protein
MAAASCSFIEWGVAGITGTVCDKQKYNAYTEAANLPR